MIIVAIVLIAIAAMCIAGVVCAIMEMIEDRKYDARCAQHKFEKRSIVKEVE